MEKLILLGAGGHCLACIEAIESSGIWEIIGIIDKELSAGNSFAGYKILGDDNTLGSFLDVDTRALVTVGQIKSAETRTRLFEEVSSFGYTMPVVVAKSATLSKRAEVGDGTVLLHNAVVNTSVTIGKNCIVNSGAIVEHGSCIGDHCHISTGAIVNGDCEVGTGTFIGSGAVLRNGIRITDGVVIGAGSVVISDVLYPGTYAGNPARFLY